MSPISQFLFDQSIDIAKRHAVGLDVSPLNASELQAILDGLGVVAVNKPNLTLVKG